MSSCLHPPTPSRLSRPFPLRPLLSSLALALAIGCGGGGSSDGGTITTPAGPVATTAVNLRASSFDPASILVPPGARVTFTNLDGIDHNVSFSSTSIGASGNFSAGSVSLSMPSAPGTYAYRCTIHSGMTGSVTVQ